MKLVYFTLAVLAQAAFLSAAPQKCKAGDSDCIKSAAQAMVPTFVAGFPDLGIDVLDPLHVDTINIDLAGLKMDLSNIDFAGYKDAVIDKLELDMEKKQMHLVFHSDVVITSKYVASGQLLILPISGDGDMKLNLNHVSVDALTNFQIGKNKDGKDIIELKESKLSLEVKKKSHFDFKNLFNGNKKLSDAMLKFMNDSWELLAKEFSGSVLTKPHKKVLSAIKKYMKSVPLEELFEQ